MGSAAGKHGAEQHTGLRSLPRMTTYTVMKRKNLSGHRRAFSTRRAMLGPFGSGALEGEEASRAAARGVTLAEVCIYGAR
jgi:hypothetical protein